MTSRHDDRMQASTGPVGTASDNGMFGRVAPRVAIAAFVVLMSGCAVWQGQQDASAYATDAGITTRIKASHAKDPAVAATAIQVETLNGTVQLSGFAKNQAEKDRAAALAREVSGVKTVRNDIIVRP